MRAPWLQLAMEIIELAAPDLAVVLNVDECEVGWGLVKVYRWALARCPEDRPPSASDVIRGPAAARLIANAFGWKGDPEVLVVALEASTPAILQRVDDGIRIRGLNRYDALWKKNFPGKAAAWERIAPKSVRNRPETAPKSVRNRPETAPPDPDPETEADQPPPPPIAEAISNESVLDEGDDVVAAVDNPANHTPERWPELLWRWFGVALEEEHAGAQLGLRPRGWDAWANKRLVDGTGPPPRGNNGVFRAWTRYLRDEHFAEQGWPVAIFLTDNVWGSRTAPWPEKKRRL